MIFGIHITLPIIIKDNWQNLEVIEKIGEGSFGEVWRGIWTKYDKDQSEEVAIKTLKENTCIFYEQELKVLKAGKFLRKHKNKLPERWLILYCYQITEGMEYLISNNLLHCDLSVRNVLLRNEKHIEICDFGLVRSIKKQKSGALNIVPDEAAIELLTGEKNFSEQSDVWSFGITCWEIFNYGADSYPEIRECFVIDREELIDYLKRAKRMDIPEKVHPELRNIMLECKTQGDMVEQQPFLESNIEELPKADEEMDLEAENSQMYPRTYPLTQYKIDESDEGNNKQIIVQVTSPACFPKGQKEGPH
uniref:Protein kinase domain-containing protein n=1 Tax=Acrobeloides nanus TaxID=290746 RepID=A0A914CMJ5_9BILA